ncbi:MAG: MFS transporter [Bacteroidales bacterium]
MKIKTGQGSISVLTLLGIWSISAITSLPGLAVSPILGDLDKIFPHTSDLEIQMLSSLPSLLIIPFVLLSGKLSENKNKIGLLMIGLLIFIASGILYFFAESMMALILISCLLGVGAGMIIPLSTGLIAEFFVGKYRTMQMGLSSSITNLTLVLATFLAGWLANFNWHYPFIVYFLPVFAVILCNFLRPSFLKKHDIVTVSSKLSQDTGENTSLTPSPYLKKGENINKKMLSGLMFIYFMASYIAIIISFNLPFVIQHYNLSSSYAGTMISIFFLAIMLPGFFINKILDLLKNNVIHISFLLLALGLLFVILFKSVFLIVIGVFFVGFGYGIIQPLVYDKTTLAARPEKAVLALAFVMSVNYLAILACPFIVDFFQIIFHEKGVLFPFQLNMVIAVLVAILAFLGRKNSIFSGKSSM